MGKPGKTSKHQNGNNMPRKQKIWELHPEKPN